MDLISYLEGKGVELTETGSGQAFTHCFFCDEDPSKHGRLYFNVDESSEKYGLFVCFLCNTSGGINSLLRHFGDDPINLQTDINLSIFDAATKYYADRLMEHVQAYEYLLYKRGLTDETIRRASLGWADGGVLQHLLSSGYDLGDITASGLVNRFGNDFLDDKIVIPYKEFGAVTSLRGKDMAGKYLSLPGSNAQLFGIDAIRGERDIIITAGEMDCLLLQQMGYSACGVPGENIWKPEWTEYLEEAGRIFILFDNDKAGRSGAEKLAARLGPRTRVAEFPTSRKKIDVTEWVVNHNKGIEDFDMLFIKAKGGLLIRVHDAYEQWLNVEGNPHLVGIKFNISELDSVLNHGLLPANVMTLVARTSAGKSLMTINFLYRMLLSNSHLHILYVSLEQTRNEWFERAHRIHNFYQPGATVNDTIQFWASNFLMIDKNRLSREELEVCVDQYAYEAGAYPDIVVVDYLGYYARSYSGEEYSRVTNAVMDLKALAKERQLVAIVPHQANRQGNFGQEFAADQAKSSGAVEETSDLMLALWAPDQQVGVDPEDMRHELHMKILKSRDGGVNTKIIMQLAPLTLAIVPRSDALYERALRERQYAIAGDDWQRAVYRYRTGDESVHF
jgi:archaellum biogenesis ATPase FlaH